MLKEPGLGFSIVQQLLMYCGGTILVDSEPPKGTTFLVRLPLHQG
jgi:two-component system phosphate regulon sensor histidine kinase PhoR